MSGILGTNFSGAHWRGVTDRTELIARARSARDALGHRGADFSGDWYDDRFFLGQAEQGHLDSEVVGRLPLSSNKAAVTVILDGHITNAHALRQSLGKKHAFRGNAGAEVVAQAYLQWGFDDMLARLRGSFALALYDRVNSRVCLARDALGTRPLYYLHEELANGEVGSLMFASELKAIEMLSEKSLLSVDYTAVYDYLTHRYVPAPKTLYQQVRKLGAGESLSVDLLNGFSATQSYWQPPEPDPSSYTTQAEFIEHAQELLAAAVSNRLPINGAQGPGVAGICQRSSGFASWLNEHQPRVELVFDGPDDAATIADLDSHDLRGFFDEPFADVSFAARHQLLAGLEGRPACALTDLGAEVVFGTAPRYRQVGAATPGTLGWFKSKLGNTPGGANSASSGATDAFNNYTRVLGGLTPQEKTRQKAAWDIPDDYNDHWYFQRFYRADLPRTLRFQWLDLQTLVPEHLLTQLDRQASRHDVEARAPLLDQDLLSWLLGAPAEFRGPQLDVQTALLGDVEGSAPILSRLKQSLKGAASFLPGGKNNNAVEGTWPLLKSRFPELDRS